MKPTRLLLLASFLTPMLSVSPARASSQKCFNETFCSTGQAPRYILCSRGQDCSRAIDRGIQFKDDCTVSRWLGDAQLMERYEVRDDRIRVIQSSVDPSEREEFTLKRAAATITSSKHPEFVWAASFCKSNGKR